jgi:hypothetical protein
MKYDGFGGNATKEHVTAYRQLPKCRPDSPIPRDFSSLFTINAGTLGKAQAQGASEKIAGITTALSCHGIDHSGSAMLC